MPQPSLPTESLAYALQRAAQALESVQKGTALPQALAQATIQCPPAARAASQDLAYRAVRRLGSSRALLDLLVKSALQARVRDILLCALALLRDPPEGAAYTEFTVVDQAVEAIAAQRRTAAAKGLANAVLRRFLRERNALTAQIAEHPEARWNYPLWWIDTVREAYPDRWEMLLAAGDSRGPMTLRVNTRRISVAQMQANLAQAGMQAEVIGPVALRLAQAVPVERLPGFANGWVSVQDAGAQLAAPLVLGEQPHAGLRVLDACAAPGGKTGHLLEMADVHVTALESDRTRVPRIYENLERLGLQADVRIGDAGNPSKWSGGGWDGVPFDRILADVPCSAAGIVRRHPDIRWLRRASDIAALVDEQRRILLALWDTLAVGGELIYATCSIFPAENERQAQWFERVRSDAVRLDAPGQLLMTPGGAHDGFYYARFQKR
ncbi:16S rRNA (cytosine(967)-C(5))-methyltransferase [Pandoraea faecigallinarum]|uniref:16S rRNA (cytosine(967)-C(5))-methyltransferase n=1 Tax=Pandoraea faecigallinarum TaxID=656179 RepID=A0A0H3WSV1_9BURK|nr:16S rRNA (cytosine(967)-C(5))-methyltransferase RsmB [Pandoraea faecigallinarum]AKM30700.1 16S rRNA (cytosine(967)-C(5))-methyltransferase [Pandoraea faecigallinarum]